MKKIVFISFLLCTDFAFAVAAKVLFTENKVTATHNGSVRTLARGSNLDIGDQIITAENASIHLQYTNGSLVNLGGDTNYKILDYAPNKDVEIKAELSKGKLELQNTGKIKETLKTPIVSLAILGTKCMAYVRDGSTNFMVDEGLVLVQSLINGQREFLRPGDSVVITPKGIENSPFPKEGFVESPSDTAGKIEAQSASSTGAASDSQASATSGATTTTLVNDSLVVASGTSSSTQSVESSTTASVANIAITACNTL